MRQIHEIDHYQKKSGTFPLNFVCNGLKLHWLNSDVNGQIKLFQHVAALAEKILQL